MRPSFALPLFLAAAACATAPKGNPAYLAKVNDEVIAGDDLRQEFSRHHASLDKILGDKPEIEKYLDRLIDRRLFIQEGRAMGIEDTPEVKADLARYEAQEIFKAFMKDEVDAKVAVTDEEVKAAFALISDRIDVRQIVVATREEADQIAYLLKWGGDFETLARARSKSPSATRGGMTIVRWGADEAREQVVAGLKVGETSPVFLSSEGWEVIRMERRAPNQMMAMDKASNFIRQTIDKRKRTATEEALRASLRATYDARLLDCAPTLESLKAAAKLDDATPCATWRGGKLTASELARTVHIDKLEEMPGAYVKIRPALVDEFLDRELVKLEATARGYPLRPEIVAKVKRRQDDLVEAKLYADWVIKKVEVTDAEMKAYYGAHLVAFKEELQLELAQIVVDTPEQAAEVEAKLKAKEPFEELAATYSKDKANADKGGYVGVVKGSELGKEFSAVTLLAAGQVSAPIQSKLGYHVVRVLAVKPEHQLSFDEAKDQVRAKALEEQRSAAQQRWVKKLRDGATIEVSQAGILAYQDEQLRRLREAEAKDAAKAAAKEAASKDAAATSPDATQDPKPAATP